MTSPETPHIWRRRFAQLTSFSVLFLIFAGGMVTSTGSGLAVPDWPLSYGMLFPPMVGGVFYEHGHRMVASVVGVFMLILAVWIGRTESRRWVRGLAYFALAAVITQGLLGGLTVLFFLPKPISISHAVLAQTFFILTIVIAYSQSNERNNREREGGQGADRTAIGAAVAMSAVIYIQLILGALMRHTGSGLAIPDFPTMGGQWIPDLGADMMASINAWRFHHGLDAVSQNQVLFHLLHRLGAVLVVAFLVRLDLRLLRAAALSQKAKRALIALNALIAVQFLLGVFTVWSGKAPVLTSLHVATGAASLGMSIILCLRVMPLSLGALRALRTQTA